MNNSRDCWSCAKRAAGCAGMTGPRDLEPACWVPENKAKTLQEIIEEWETGRVYVIPARGNGKTAAMKAALERTAEQAQQIKQHLTETRLTPSTEELLEGVQVERKTPTVAELSAREEQLWAAMTAPMHAQELAEKAAQEQTRMTDEAIRRLLEERCPGTPIEAFCSSFIPGGFRLTAPDGTAFDFVYTTHGPSTAGGTTTVTVDLTVTETKTGGEQE